jgi:hypothetical protein
MSNDGKIYLQQGKEPWRMKRGEAAPTGNEFEKFIEELDSFLKGYFSAPGFAKHARVRTRGFFL